MSVSVVRVADAFILFSDAVSTEESVFAATNMLGLKIYKYTLATNVYYVTNTKMWVTNIQIYLDYEYTNMFV